MYVYFTYYQLQEAQNFFLLKVILEGEGPTEKSK
jgi:hypothetical protein